jgi:methylenetetrahydrofolate--tRNA-(uracil-5-)-methyltransferase
MMRVTVIGAGLAGSEAAWQLAQRGVMVDLFEMRPQVATPAHHTDHFAELVCSNSFRSADPSSAVGLLKEELRQLGSLIMTAADATAVPAGKALAVDRELFSQYVTDALCNHPNIFIHREEVKTITSPLGGEVGRRPGEGCPVILATGPLTSPALAQELLQLTQSESLYFYDSLAPLILTESIDTEKTFRAGRYDVSETQEGDYINCPMTKDQYDNFVAALLAAEKVQPKEFEKAIYFEGCMPIEVMAERGPLTLRFGPMKAVGLTDPKTGRWPYAVVQLRQDNRLGTVYNMVGFQTRMKWGAQAEILRTIPGLENAEILRYGAMHRNMYVNSPQVLNEDHSLKVMQHIHLAGQMTGVEGYLESAASGWFVGTTVAAKVVGKSWPLPPAETSMGAMLRHVLYGNAQKFEPHNVHWGLFPPLTENIHKTKRREAMLARARIRLSEWSGLFS